MDGTGNTDTLTNGNQVGVVDGWVVPLLWRFGTIIGGLVVVALGTLYMKQESLLYFPAIGGMPRSPSDNPRRYRSPAEHEIPYETHRIRCADGISIHSWLLLHPHSKEKKLPTIIFFHGNAGNIGFRLPNAIQMFQYLNANILMVEYRGYGDSDDAKINEQGLKLDGEAVLQFILQHDKVDRNRIYVFGRSLGGAVVFHLAQYAQESGIALAGLLVENTFLSISSMVDTLMPFLKPIKPLVLTLDWNNGKVAPRISAPILYLAGAKDELVPPFHMKQLFQASSKVSRYARMHAVKDGTHNDTWLQGGRPYWEAIRIFLSETAGLSGGDLATTSGGSSRISASTTDTPVIDVQNESSAIPIMPKGLVGMAREAAAATETATADSTSSAKKDL